MKLLVPRCSLLLVLTLLPVQQGSEEASIAAQAQAIANPKCDYSQVEISQECPSTMGFDWESFGETLYRGRSLVFLGDVDGAKAGIHQLLRMATTPFSLAFECPPAVAAAYFSMAQILAFQGRMRRALAMIQMGFIFIRDKGFNECTPWPLQGWDMLLAGRNLAHKVRELDNEAVLLQSPPSLRSEGLRIAVVTICAYAQDEVVRVVSQQNHQLYTQLHGYDLHFFTDVSQIPQHVEGRMNVQDGRHKPFFWKVNAVRNVFDSHKNYDWVLWADCDAFFMEPERTIDSIIHMYTANLTIPTVARKTTPTQATGEVTEVHEIIRNHLQADGAPPVSLIIAVDSTGINNGVWLLRNNAWARQFLDEWWHSNILDGPGKEHNCSDQSTMQHHLIHERAMTLDDNWDAVEGPIWPREVRVAAQEHLQSFHQATAMTVASREWEDGDFIKHHPGCHYYKDPCKQLYLEAATIFENKVRALLQQQALL